MRNHKAFSLVELLIVITIIGILAVAFLPSITSGPARARDVQRIADLGEVAIALQLHFQDYGTFPGSIYSTDLEQYFESGSVPTDPITGWTSPYSSGVTSGGNYFYELCSSNAGYVLAADMENAKASDGYYAPPGTSTLCNSGTVSFAAATGGDDEATYIMYENRD